MSQQSGAIVVVRRNTDVRSTRAQPGCQARPRRAFAALARSDSSLSRSASRPNPTGRYVKSRRAHPGAVEPDQGRCAVDHRARQEGLAHG